MYKINSTFLYFKIFVHITLNHIQLASSYRFFNLQNVPLPSCVASCRSRLLFSLTGQTNRGNTTSFNRRCCQNVALPREINSREN